MQLNYCFFVDAVTADQRAVRTRPRGATFEGDVVYWPRFAALESRQTRKADLRVPPPLNTMTSGFCERVHNR